MVFDELNSWYRVQNGIQDDVEKEDVLEKGVQQESQKLSGPGESSNMPTKAINPWSKRLRSGSSNVSTGSAGSKIGSIEGKEKVDEQMIGFDVGHSSGDESLDEELGIPSV